MRGHLRLKQSFSFFHSLFSFAVFFGIYRTFRVGEENSTIVLTGINTNKHMNKNKYAEDMSEAKRAC